MYSVSSNAVYNALHNSGDVFIATKGSCTLPNGLILKWGQITGGTSSNDDWYETYDTDFPNGCFKVMVTPVSGAAVCPNGWYIVETSVSGIRLFCQGSAPVGGFAYLAVGK